MTDRTLFTVPASIGEDEADVLGMPVSFYERAVRFGRQLTAAQGSAGFPRSNWNRVDKRSGKERRLPAAPANASGESRSILRRKAAQRGEPIPEFPASGKLREGE